MSLRMEGKVLKVRRMVRDSAPVDDSDSGVTDFLDDVTSALDFHIRSNSCSGQLQLSFGMYDDDVYVCCSITR